MKEDLNDKILDVFSDLIGALSINDETFIKMREDYGTRLEEMFIEEDMV